MNQKTIIGIAGLIIFLMCLFPPWLQVYRHPGMPAAQTSAAGYHSILSAPLPIEQEMYGRNIDYVGIKLDIQRLFLQIVAVSVLTGALLFIARKKE